MTATKSVRALLAADDEYLARARNYRICLHPLAPQGCSGPIAECHTVQRQGDGLARIARGHHVYAQKTNLVGLEERQGTIDLSLIGTRQARTFPGFCSQHDSDLFRPLETAPFQALPEQLGLIMYRTVAHVLWKKRVKIAAHDRLRRAFAAGSVDHRIATMKEFGAMVRSDQGELDLGQSLKDSLDSIVVSRNWSRLESVVVWCDTPPPVMVCASTYPSYDFLGQQLQDLSRPSPGLDVIGVSSLASGQGGVFGLTWLKGAKSAKALAHSLLKLKKAEIPAAMIRFVFQFTEDLCVSPEWWDGLPAGQRKLLRAHMNDGLSPLRPYHADWFDRQRTLTTGTKMLRAEFR